MKVALPPALRRLVVAEAATLGVSGPEMVRRALAERYGVPWHPVAEDAVDHEV